MHVLIVEDEPKVAAFLKKGLQEEQWHVSLASDGEEALIILDDTDFSVIVLDIMMPKLDGLTVLRTLRQQGNNTPVLLLTAMEVILTSLAIVISAIWKYLCPNQCRIGRVIMWSRPRPRMPPVTSIMALALSQ